MAKPPRLACIAACLFALSACASLERAREDFDRSLADRALPFPRDEATCRAQGGQWQEQPKGHCIPPPPTDAGKTCRSLQDCQGYCELTPGAVARYGDRVAGRCSANYGVQGCASFVHQGRYVTRICD